MEVNGMQRIVFIITELDKSCFPLQKFIHLPYLFVSLQFCIYYCAFYIFKCTKFRLLCSCKVFARENMMQEHNRPLQVLPRSTSIHSM